VHDELREYIEGRKNSQIPLIIEVDKEVRSYLYALYDHVDDHSNGNEIEGQDATNSLEEGVEVIVFTDKKLKK